jgi:hypothetical protein
MQLVNKSIAQTYISCCNYNERFLKQISDCVVKVHKDAKTNHLKCMSH